MVASCNQQATAGKCKSWEGIMVCNELIGVVCNCVAASPAAGNDANIVRFAGSCINNIYIYIYNVRYGLVWY